MSSPHIASEFFSLRLLTFLAPNLYYSMIILDSFPINIVTSTRFVSKEIELLFFFVSSVTHSDTDSVWLVEGIRESTKRQWEFCHNLL
jgi:hypothetical protein